MQPKSIVQQDEKSMDVLNKTIKDIVISNRERKKNPRFATALPQSIAIKLTNKCNLRCKHCYQWNESGHHRFMSKTEQEQEIDMEIIQRLLADTKEEKSRLYLWGGEPLCHSKISDILDLLHSDPREVSICTNGILIEENLEALLGISDTLEFLIAIEGFEEEHDLIRGKGTFRKTMKAIDALLELRRKGEFKGKISIHTMINENMVLKTYDLLEYFQQKGIDLVLLCFPWYISPETSLKMDCYFQEKFNFITSYDAGQQRSWHAFKYMLNPEVVKPLLNELERINRRVWNMRIRYQPELDFNELEDFLLGKEVSLKNTSKCLGLSTRTDILPNGGVTACKQFSEFTVGNLYKDSLVDIWNSETYGKIRETIHCELMPVCSKCNVLYLHGI